MEDYPRTAAEFEARFATEEACRAYPVRVALARRLSLPVWRGERLADSERALAVCRVRRPDLSRSRRWPWSQLPTKVWSSMSGVTATGRGH